MRMRSITLAALTVLALGSFAQAQTGGGMRPDTGSSQNTRAHRATWEIPKARRTPPAIRQAQAARPERRVRASVAPSAATPPGRAAPTTSRPGRNRTTPGRAAAARAAHAERH